MLNLGIDMDQGADFALMIVVSGINGPVDLTGYSFLGEMRATTESIQPLVAEFVFAVQDQFLQKGMVMMSLPAAIVDAIPLSVSNQLQQRRLKTPFVFDVKMKNTSNLVIRILEGIVYVSPEATVEAFP